MAALRRGCLISGITVVVCLAVAEGVLRRHPFFAGRSGVMRPRPGLHAIDDTVRVLTPGYKGRHTSRDFSVALRVNSEGFRERELDDESLASRRPILITGDSYFFGWGVERGDRFSEQLAGLLGGQESAPPVVNLSSFGFGTYHYADVLARFGPKLSPRLVIVGFFVGNDFSDDRQVEAVRRLEAGTDPDEAEGFSFRALVGNSALFNLAQHAMWGIPMFRAFLNRMDIRNDRIELYETVPSPSREALFARTFGVLTAMASWSKAQDVPLLVVIIPDHLQVLAPGGFRGMDLTQPQDRLKQHLEGLGVSYLDLLPLLQHVDGMDALYFREDKHWTPAGHRFVAEALMAWLRDRDHTAP